MKKYNSVIIGHITLDYNTDHLGVTEKRAGGAVLYSSGAGYALGHNVLAVTSVGKGDESYLESFTLPKENVHCVVKDSSCIMKNHYLTADKERRNSVCAMKGTPFTISDVPDVDSPIYHLAGLVVGDFDGTLITELAKKGKVVLDAQGFLRNVSATDGKMFFADWSDKKKYLPYITYLKTDALETEILTGTSDRYEGAKILHGWGAKEVLITHNSEVLVYDGKEFFTCPIRARNLSGRTGRGDTTTAVYTLERERHDIKTALLIATATVSLKMETPGVFSGNRDDVMKYIDEFYNDYK
ncbi:MAG: ribokinase [Clostridia bacterium]|nr:ribokinase [Clostridia bacterium]